MKRAAALALLLVAIAPSVLRSQWIQFKAEGVPRLRNGQPNLNAPAPRGADGTPDLSGIWYLSRPGVNAFGQADYVAAPEFFDLGAKLPGGLPYQPWAAELVAQRKARLGAEDPIGRCRPAGAIRVLTMPPPRKFIQLPKLFVILSERDVTYRQVFLDHRPRLDDPQPTWNGYSTGRWEGDSLVVNTIGLRDDTWLDRNGSPMTASARVREQFRRINYGRLDIELTVDDAKAYTRAWTVTLTQVLAPDTELLDYHCLDNEKDAARLQ